MSIDYAHEYNNRAHIPNTDEILGRIRNGAIAYRAQALARRPDDMNLRYGPTPRQVIDLFRADAGTDAPLAVFIHGGFWRSLDPTHFSEAAKGLNGRGIDVALAGYDLTPQVTIGDIVEQMRQACLYLWGRFDKRLLVFGHSAGGHLAAALFATDWTKFGAPADLIPAATGISGVYELPPLIHTPMNEDFRLTEAEAVRQSPLFWNPPAGRPFDVIVGAKETNEFLRQSRTLADVWSKAGVITRLQEPAGENHFTVIEPLADQASPMVDRLVQLAQMTR
ncbi:MAG: alpha/beta hydrolase [Proteobacteria bacterium]|jgi:arylformamidase|nr:MAG: alpha/beta hydrolase [Pseudomonadota bacterium]